MKRSLVLSIIFFTLSVLCFAGYGYQKHKEDMRGEQENIWGMSGLYASAQSSIVDRYIKDCTILKNDEDHGLTRRFIKDSSIYTIVTVPGKPFIDHIEYKNYVYPDFYRTDDIFYEPEIIENTVVSDERKEESKHKCAASAVMPLIYYSAYQYTRYFPDKTAGRSKLDIEEVLAEGYLDDIPALRDYITSNKDKVEIFLSDNGASVDHIKFMEWSYEPNLLF